MIEMGERLIGRYTGQLKGPLMICLGGMHGNESAGVEALTLLLKMIEVEPITNPDFQFRGRIVAFKGNVRALEKGVRFFKNDLNRIWKPETIERVVATPIWELKHEELELRELIEACHEEIEDYQPEQIVILDLHTTSCEGGIFSIVREDLESIELGIELHAPVIRGMMTGLNGTTLHYFHQSNFQTPITSIVFESGQHDNPLSINRAIAATINCLRTTGHVRAEHVENVHDQLLISHSRDLPKVAQLMYYHHIEDGDEFKMEPGYTNFDAVKKDEVLAQDRHGPIKAKQDGLLLMPLYQEQGQDGFFIIEKHDPSTLPKRKKVAAYIGLQ